MKATLIPVVRETRDPWDVAAEFEDVFDSDSELETIPRMMVRTGLWHPTMDIYNRPDEIVVELEVPGVDMKDVTLTVRENHLIVEGSRKEKENKKDEARFFSEREYGAFHRVVHLPTEVNTEKTEARLQDGMLVIRLPKSTSEGGKTIKIIKE